MLKAPTLYMWYVNIVECRFTRVSVQVKLVELGSWLSVAPVLARNGAWVGFNQ